MMSPTRGSAPIDPDRLRGVFGTVELLWILPESKLNSEPRIGPVLSPNGQKTADSYDEPNCP
jgi:hypothetical protein